MENIQYSFQHTMHGCKCCILTGVPLQSSSNASVRSNHKRSGYSAGDDLESSNAGLGDPLYQLLKWHWFSRPENLKYFNILDEASRGPFGSIELLLRTQRPTVVGVGVFIAILALRADPFRQQIISYPTRSVEAGNSSLARAQMYDTGFHFVDSELVGGVIRN
jgi:hypothetical protein